MQTKSKGRVVALAVALAGAALLQGCAVTTGVYVPDRSSLASHSMLSRFDKRFDMRYSPYSSTPSTGSALHMPRERQGGVLYFHY